MRALEHLSRQRYVSPYWYAVVHAGIRDYEATLSWLEKACEERDVWLTWLKLEPRFEHLRSDSRFLRPLHYAFFVAPPAPRVCISVKFTRRCSSIARLERITEVESFNPTSRFDLGL